MVSLPPSPFASQPNVCLRCGEPVSAGRVACDRCGGRYIRRNDGLCVECGGRAAPQSAFCAACAAQYDDRFLHWVNFRPLLDRYMWDGEADGYAEDALVERCGAARAVNEESVIRHRANLLKNFYRDVPVGFDADWWAEELLILAARRPRLWLREVSDPDGQTWKVIRVRVYAPWLGPGFVEVVPRATPNTASPDDPAPAYAEARGAAGATDEHWRRLRFLETWLSTARARRGRKRGSVARPNRKTLQQMEKAYCDFYNESKGTVPDKEDVALAVELDPRTIDNRLRKFKVKGREMIWDDFDALMQRKLGLR